MEKLHIKNFREGFKAGYNLVCKIGEGTDWETEFGIRVLEKGKNYKKDLNGEVCILFLGAKAKVKIDEKEYNVERKSLFDENPFTFSVGQNHSFSIEAQERTELVEAKTANDREFEPIVVSPEEVKVEHWGEKRLLDQRIVKCCWNYDSHPESNLVIGEVVAQSGNSSSYPPHTHSQPEIYFYRVEPPQGYGLCKVGEESFVVKNNDAVKILNGADHPQYVAPGYALWYLWLIRHLPGNPYTGFRFLPEHEWMLDKKAKIWRPK